MRKFLLVLFSLILFSHCTKRNDLPVTINLDENWEFKVVDSLAWHEAAVPGTIFTDLIHNDIIEDPFIKNNEEKVQWVPQKDWIYQTTFELSNYILAKKHIKITFEGLDTYSKIYLNDTLLGYTDNAFRYWTFDVKSLAKKKNKLKVIFQNFDDIEQLKKRNNPYTLPEGNRIYTRKAQFQYGWDWGPKLNTVGIWKPIHIKAWNDYTLQSVYIKQKNISNNEATIELALEEQNSTPLELEYEVYVNHELKTKSTTPNIQFTIDKPKLWWTHNLGEPYLYDLSVLVKKGSTLLDSNHTKFGVRNIELITQKDSIGESFYFQLNGKPIYSKGANYIPQNSFQNKVTEENYKELIDDVVDANMNMLRVWGGGIYENDIFYNLCDEKGILVWQDFMFACAMYPGDTHFLKNVTIEAEQQVKRLRNHPAIALWCGNNENSEGWHRWGWQENRSEQEKEAIWKDYLALFDSILPNTVSTYSQSSYWESSPKFGRGNPKYEFEGDAHDWWVWHDAYPFEHLAQHVPRFMSEYGFQSYPSEEVIQYINQKETVDLSTQSIKTHQKHTRGFELIDTYLKRDYPVPNNYEDYAYVSQLVQARGISLGINAHRRAKPYNMGTLYWQLNDCWPAISWSSIDYFGNWKALHYKVKKAYENILISTVKEDGNYKTYLVNDSFELISDTLKLRVIDFYGKEIWSDTIKVNLEPNSSKSVYELPNIVFDKTRTLLHTTFQNNEEIFVFDKPKALELPKNEILISTDKISDGFKVTLESMSFQKGVYLKTKAKGKFSDNFFDLLPNSPKIIIFKTADHQLEKINYKTLASIKN